MGLSRVFRTAERAEDNQVSNYLIRKPAIKIVINLAVVAPKCDFYNTYIVITKSSPDQNDYRRYLHLLKSVASMDYLVIPVFNQICRFLRNSINST